MKRKRVGLLAGAATAAVVILALWYRAPTPAAREGDASTFPIEPRKSMGARPVDVAQGGDQVASADVPVKASAPRVVRNRFRTATDYAVFIDSVLSDARAGDRDAQYYIHAALTFCDTEFRGLFKRRSAPGWLTHDEGLNRAARRRNATFSYVDAVDQKCRVLMEGGRSELGDSRKWLEDAASKGQPLAMVALAELQLIDTSVGRRDKSSSAGARDLLMSALESKEPEVMWKIGELQGFLRPDTEDMKAQWAWMLVACERGYDCGRDSPFMEFSCLYDLTCGPDETAVAYIKRFLQTDLSAVEEMAREINANIDAEAWSDIDIGG